MGHEFSAPVCLFPMWSFQPPQLVTASTQEWLLQLPNAHTKAQDGNLITYLNKSQFKPPRGLALYLDKPPEQAYSL